MFEVLVFVYENYCPIDANPQWEQLERKLNAVGFEAEEIQEALVWLRGLSLVASGARSDGSEAEPSPTQAHRALDIDTVERGCPGFRDASATSMRIYSTAEQDHLGSQCLGFVSFLESTGVLTAQLREIVVDRAMAAPGDPDGLDDLKIIVLMVYWSFGEEPDALVLDELCDDARLRVAH